MSTPVQQVETAPVAAANGDFVWHELKTTDAKAASDFYTHVIGWTATPTGNPGGIPYTRFSFQGTGVAGVMDLPPDMQSAGIPPHWSGYIGVDDVDAYAQRIQERGGKLHCPPQEIPGIGRWASVEDPQGASFLLFKLQPKPNDGPALPFGSPGTVGWNELSANDGEAAWPFYSNLFGWTEVSTMDMGAMGLYRMFKNGGPGIGAIMTRDPNTTPVPFWLFYFSVDDIDAAAARVKEKNGQVIMGPHEVPGPIFIIVGTDPQGAIFALVGPRK